MASGNKTLNLNIDYNKFCNSSKYQKHAVIFPNSIRMIIAGSSGCGKTNLMLNFLLSGVLCYNDVVIYTTTPHQELYEFLKNYYDEIKKQYRLAYKIVTFLSPEDSIADPSELDPDKTHIVIFDDVMNEKQKVMTDYFCRGRHNNSNVFYLCQSLHQLPKHGIRQNANIFVLFYQDNMTLEHFFNTEISGDMKLKEFETFCNEAWAKDHGYIVVNLWEKPEFGKYMQNYEKVYIPLKFRTSDNTKNVMKS